LQLSLDDLHRNRFRTTSQSENRSNRRESFANFFVELGSFCLEKKSVFSTGGLRKVLEVDVRRAKTKKKKKLLVANNKLAKKIISLSKSRMFF